MNAWPFIYVAYAIAILATVALTASSWRAMRRAEQDAAKVGRES